MVKIYMQVFVSMKSINDWKFGRVVLIDQDDEYLRIIDEVDGLAKIWKDDIRGFTISMGKVEVIDNDK